MVLVPAFHCGAANAMSQGKLALADTAFMSLKDFQSEAFRCSKSGSQSFKRMPKVTMTLATVILGHSQMQQHHLITLAGVLDCPAVTGFDSDRTMAAMNTMRPLIGLSPDLNLLTPFNINNCQIGNP